MRALLKKLEAAFSTGVTTHSFGRSDEVVAEVSAKILLDVAAWLRMEESFRLDFLEMFSVAELKDQLQFSFFLRSYTRDVKIVLRTRLLSPAAKEWIEFPSMVRIWPQAEAFESELSSLFGIRFLDGPPASSVRKNFGTYDGFPLRKSYTWNHEVEP